MSSSVKIVSKADLKLEYFISGSGEEIIICMHGHGRNASDFEFIAGDNRRVISIHLFHHGNSHFPIERIEQEPLKSNEFIALFKLILENESINQFHLFAFSQGGRFSLCLIPYFANKMKTITLISPDGMDNKSFYNWSSRRRWARNIFRYFEKDPSRLSTYSEIARRIGIMRPKVASFVSEFSSNQDSFIRASRTWRTFRSVKPDYKSTSINKLIHLLPFMEHSLSLNQISKGNEQHP
jgi:pimeloyl-ACP methyl ester carboxylesterase